VSVDRITGYTFFLRPQIHTDMLTDCDTIF